jgi:hypothetical protein
MTIHPSKSLIAMVLHWLPRLFSCFAIVLFSLTVPSALLAQSTGSIIGLVKDETGEPIPSVRVEIPALEKGALTDDEGIYSFSRIEAGKHQMRLTYPGKDTINQEISLQAGQALKLDFILKDLQLNTIEVTDENIGKINREAVNVAVTKITAREISLLPSLGTPDLAQYLQVLPGVVFTGDQGGQLFVRGGTPIQNMVILDGAIIYNPFHTIGLYSIFDTDIIRNVDVYSGGFSGEYGGRVSSVMDIRTRSGNFQRFSGKVHANPITAGALLEGPLFAKSADGQAPASFMVSARHCYLNQTASSLYSYVDEERGLPFSFTDLYGKFTLGNGTNQLSLFAFNQQDKVDYKVPTSYSWRQSGGGLTARFVPPGSSVIIDANVAISRYENNQLEQTEAYPRRSSINGFNGRFNFGNIINSIHRLDYGIALLGFSTDLSFANSLGIRTEQAENNTELAAYAKYKHVFLSGTRIKGSAPFERFVFEPSVRMHYYNDQQHFSLEPRIRTKLNFKRVSFQFAAGAFTQNLISSTSDRDVVVLFQGFMSAPLQLPDKKLDHSLQAAMHLLGGVELELMPNLSTTIEGWYKNFNQLSNINRMRLFPEDRVFITETGTALGFDLMLKYSFEQVYLYATYSWMRIERTDAIQTYNPVFDRRHTSNFVGSYFWGQLRDKKTQKLLDPKWEISARWTLGSGFPFTQTQGFFERINFGGSGALANLVTQNGELGFIPSDQFNGGRLPAYHRLDLSIKRRFQLGTRSIFELNLNAINVYNRANIFYFDRISYQRADQLPFIPTVGAIFSF